MKAEPVYFIEDEEEPRELEDLGDGLAMRAPQDQWQAVSMAYHTMDPQKNLELAQYFTQTDPEAYQTYKEQVDNYTPVEGYEEESKYDLDVLKSSLDPSNPVGLRDALKIYQKHRSELEAPETPKSEPYGYFEMNKQPYKLIGREWKMLDGEGNPLSPGEQYRRQAGMFTGKLDNNGTRR